MCNVFSTVDKINLIFHLLNIIGIIMDKHFVKYEHYQISSGVQASLVEH